jgi:hypothetical protein
MANQMDARAAFSAHSTGIPRVQEEIEKAVLAGLVRPVYAEKPEDVKGKSFRDFLIKFGILTSDPQFKKTERVGGGGKSYHGAVDELTGGQATAIKTAVKALNVALKDTPYLAHFYVKSKDAIGSKAKAETPIAQ